MRVSLNELLKKLGIEEELAPYESRFWFHSDDSEALSCSAEVRMGPENTDLEAEIQLLQQNVSEGQKPQEQVLIMRALPVTKTEWGPKYLIIQGHNYTNEFYDWEGKGCAFFTDCIQSLQMGEIPDFDELVDKHMQDDERSGRGKRGKIGRKSPSVNPNTLLGIKKGM